MTTAAFDREVSGGDVQALADADAVAGFFAQLGYDTAARLPQTPTALGITPESLRRKIRRVERIADQEGGALQVYLFELDSVTVQATHAIARTLRDRSPNFLLVLTSDYEDLDFVLLERELPRADVPRFGSLRVAVRPRVLTVDRRNPGVVALRVLRRFTYTEADADAQFDKLRSAYAVAEWSEPYFNNRALFSDYYLNVRLRETAAWAEDPKPAYQQLRVLYAGARERLANEAHETVRTALIEPVLRVLGFAWVRAKGDHAPDYGLTATDQGNSVAVSCLAYPWDRYLDGKDDQRDAARPNDNPGARVVTVLDASIMPWAIVTNGKLWRLHRADAHSRATNYYEIDLEEALALADPSEAFRYFWLIFRAAAFVPRSVLMEGVAREISFADEIVHESAAYATALGDRLKERIFEEVFPSLAEGFIAYLRHVDGISTDLSQERLDQVYSAALALLYRLLFLLYAEARDLLPAREQRGYWDVSLTHLKQEVAEAAGSLQDEAPTRLARSYSTNPTATSLYDRLLELARIVDRGDPAVNTPTYSGGLFLTDVPEVDTSEEAETARFLLRHKVSDRFLAIALDRLARDVDDKRHDLVPIDYKSLGVRQLGSVYEGLLEFRLRLAPEKMAIVRGKKTEEVVPYREAVEAKLPILGEGHGKDAKERTFPRGAVYLENDRRERKASGSYYTPDFIVEYVVQRAVGPVLKEHLDRLRPTLREAERAYQQAWKNQAAFQRQGMKGDDPEKVVDDPKWRQVVDELFDFRVLDPAMGSGHFLVEAVDHLTDSMLDFLNGFRWNPVRAQIQQTREMILAEMDRQGVSIDHRKLTDVNLLKRHVLKRCVYGVDLNPMAVELAKVSLWLDCFTLGAPLSFLDHHLKCGDSLLGVSVAEVQAVLEGEGATQLSLFGQSRFAGIMLATDLMRHVGELSDVTADQVQQSRAEYARANDALAPFKRVLDIYTSRWFGNEPKKVRSQGVGKVSGMVIQRDATVEFLQSELAERWLNAAHDESVQLPLGYATVADKALAARERHRFFHWELEFPEVFFGPRHGSRQMIGLKDDPGFDAVLGNPPWVRQETLGDMKGALEALHAPVYDSIADTYVYFLGRGQDILKRNHRLGMVLPNKWLRAGYGEALRTFLTEDHQPVELVNFGHAPLFPDADTFPCVLVVAAGHDAGTSTDGVILRYCDVPREALPTIVLGDFVAQRGYAVPKAYLRNGGWLLEPPEVAQLLDKIRQHGTLGEIEPESMFRGIIPGLTEAFFVDHTTRNRLVAQDPQSEPLFRRVLRGRNIQRWHPAWDGEWLILLKSSENEVWPWGKAGTNAEAIFRRTYPALHAWMKPLQAKLEKRQDKGRYWWELRSCSYYRDLEKPKIVYQEIQFHSWFAWDDQSYLHNNKAFSLVTDQRYLAALLNSSLMWWYMWRVLPHMKDEAFAMQTFVVQQLPVPLLADDTRSTLDRQVTGLASLAGRRQELSREFFGRLGADLGLERAPRRLETFWRLSRDALADELRRVAPRTFRPLTETLVLDTYTTLAREAREVVSQAVHLEFDVQSQVFTAYGLSDAEIALVRRTAPPRDPLILMEQEAAGLDIPMAGPAQPSARA